MIYAVAVGFFAYRMLTLKGFHEAVEGSLVDVGAVMFLLALSAIFGYGIVFERIPEVISNWMLGITDNANVVMVIIVLFILLAGTFMEGSVLIIMLTPIFLPLVTKYGVDPVHFGLVFIIAATIGNYTPPVGAAMFVTCQVLRCPIGEYTRESMPFLIAVSVVTLMLIFVPEVVLFVPDLIFGKDEVVGGACQASGNQSSGIATGKLRLRGAWPRPASAELRRLQIIVRLDDLDAAGPRSSGRRRWRPDDAASPVP